MMEIERSQRGGSRLWRLLLGLMSMLLAIGAATGAAVAGDLAPDGPSLAQGHAEVITHGIAVMPAVPVVWRVVSDPAKLPADAPVGSRDLGFVLANQGDVLITDGNGEQTRLAPGEATFVPNGQQQSRASLGSSPAQYDAIELVPATGQSSTGAGTFVGASDSFTAPSGQRDLTLVRDVLKQGETSTLPDTGAPTMILVTSGTAEIRAGTTTNTRGTGTAIADTGQIKITPTGPSGAAFVAALIGPAISSSPAPQDQAHAPATGAALPPATGVIRVTTHTCQPGMNLSNFDQSRCPVTQQKIDFALTSSLLPRAYTLQDALDAGDGAWQQLPFGSYHIEQTQLPPGYNGWWIQNASETGGSPGNGYDTTISANTPASDLQVFDFSPGEQGGALPEPQTGGQGEHNGASGPEPTPAQGEHNGASGPEPTAAPPAPTQAPPEPTNPPATGGQVGDLLIVTQDVQGNPVAGACYELQGSGGTVDVCDGGGNDALSGDSRILLTQLSAGDYTITNTQVPTGYGIAATQSVTIIANGAFPGGEPIITVTLPNGIG